MVLISDVQRRARLAVRHGLAAPHRFADPAAATRAMTVLHATEPATVHLSLHSRVDGLTVADVDRALYSDRSLVKQLAMRRTLFVFPRDLLPAAWGSASARVAGFERRRVSKDAVLAGLADDGDAWLDDARRRVLDLVADRPEGVLAAEVRAVLPELAQVVSVSPGTTWNHSRVLTHLGLTADLLRGVNAGHWRISRPRWTRPADWLGVVPDPLPESIGYAELVRRWLATFGPGTELDLVWWLGGTKAAVRRALGDVGAVTVDLETGQPGWVLPGDVGETESPAPWAALLPVLDATVMGWKERDFFLGPHESQLFDRNGNAGTTAWWDGRVVGSWVQDQDARVRVCLLEEVPAAGRAALAEEAERLTAWLDGSRVGSPYSSPAMRAGRPG